jgi:hypothetical protein
MVTKDRRKGFRLLGHFSAMAAEERQGVSLGLSVHDRAGAGYLVGVC